MTAPRHFIDLWKLTAPELRGILDDAKASKATFGFKTAGWMTAPLMRRITARVGPLLGIRPELDKDIDVSDLMGLLAEKKVPGKNVLE